MKKIFHLIWIVVFIFSVLGCDKRVVTIDIEPVADAGTVNPGPGMYFPLIPLKFTATPNEGWQFLEWAGGASGTNPNVTVTLNVSGPSHLTAVFEPEGGALLAHIDSPTTESVTIDQGDTLNFAGSAYGGEPDYSYTWGFGSSGVASVSVQNPGTKQFDVLGTHTVLFTVADSAPDEASDSVTVIVTESATGLSDGVISIRMDEPDGISIVATEGWAGQTQPYTLLVGGYDGVLGIDLATGNEVIDDYVMLFAAVLGAFAVTAPWALPAAKFADAIVEFGYAGIRILPYDSDAGQWTTGNWLNWDGFVADALPFNNDMSSGGFVFAKEFSQIEFIKYDETADEWVSDSFYYGNAFPSLWNGIMSVFIRELGGSFLVVENGTPGELYFHDQTTGVSIGDLGNSPRRIRCLGDVCVVTNYDDDTINLILWDSADNVTIVDTQPVGDGPIGVDLATFPNGNIGILTTGFLDNTITITEAMPDATIVSSNTEPAPDGCTQPGHAIWALNGTLKVVTSYFGSDNISITPKF
ncbi:MAG: hypothetical protein HN368_11805 [Spirochaetales bacterium]|jgi:hypothetical protein|nr:hypothetical protein [Spirochaetales bacterium]